MKWDYIVILVDEKKLGDGMRLGAISVREGRVTAKTHEEAILKRPEEAGIRFDSGALSLANWYVFPDEE